MSDSDQSRQAPVSEQGVSSPRQPARSEQGNPLTAEISFFKNCWDRIPSHKTCILRFAVEVRVGTYRKAVEQIREFMAQGNDEQADEIKKSLPAVSLSGKVTEGERARAHKEERFQHSGYLQGDFDTKDFQPRSADEIKATLAADEHVQAVFLSAKCGVKAIIGIPVCETQAEHTTAFFAAELYFREKYGLKLDSSTKDPVRLCYVSYDPEAYVNYSPATALPIAAQEKPGGESKPLAVPPSSEYRDGDDANAKHAKLTPEIIRAMLACIPTGPDYDMWLKISSAVWAATGDEVTGTELLKDWSPEEETGEYSEKYRTRLEEITAGTLIHLARKHGYQFPSGESNDGDMHIPDDVFPLPTGPIEYSDAGEIIFSAIAPAHQLFMRGEGVHEVIADGSAPAYFAPLSPERFCSLIENYDHRVARREWQEGKGGNKGRYIWRSTRMPISTAKILLITDAARRNLSPIRQLAACPILTKEGEVIGRGYHPHAGGTFVTDGIEPHEMPVEAATTAILSLLNDFNFVSPADKSRAVASTLSPALKMGDWLDDDFPMDVAEGDKSQSGKTYRQKVVCRIYNETPSAIPAPRGGVGSLDENISASLIKGRPFIMLDNFRGKLDSPILEQAIRGAGRVACRALRISADVDTWPFNWQLSTNGAEFTRDIANRSIITRIRKQSVGVPVQRIPRGEPGGACRGAGNLFTLARSFLSSTSGHETDARRRTRIAMIFEPGVSRWIGSFRISSSSHLCWMAIVKSRPGRQTLHCSGYVT